MPRPVRAGASSPGGAPSGSQAGHHRPHLLTPQTRALGAACRRRAGSARLRDVSASLRLTFSVPDPRPFVTRSLDACTSDSGNPGRRRLPDPLLHGSLSSAFGIRQMMVLGNTKDTWSFPLVPHFTATLQLQKDLGSNLGSASHCVTITGHRSPITAHFLIFVPGVVLVPTDF